MNRHGDAARCMPPRGARSCGAPLASARPLCVSLSLSCSICSRRLAALVERERQRGRRPHDDVRAARLAVKEMHAPWLHQQEIPHLKAVSCSSGTPMTFTVPPREASQQHSTMRGSIETILKNGVPVPIRNSTCMCRSSRRANNHSLVTLAMRMCGPLHPSVLIVIVADHRRRPTWRALRTRML